MNYNETMEYIESIQSYGIVPGLDSIKELCARLGNPQNPLRFAGVDIQVKLIVRLAGLQGADAQRRALLRRPEGKTSGMIHVAFLL